MFASYNITDREISIEHSKIRAQIGLKRVLRRNAIGLVRCSEIEPIVRVCRRRPEPSQFRDRRKPNPVELAPGS
jgi:hypothetical protein